jgi:hypothetical protein
MQDKEKPEFGARILAIGLMYEKQITKPVIDLYWSALHDLELVDIDRALQIHMRDPERGRFMPKPADVRFQICRPEKNSLIAWRQVEDAYCRFNYYQTVQFEDGTINAVIRDMGGWQWFSSQNLDEPWTQKEFERRYEAYKGQRIELHEPLPGFHELENRNKGFIEHVPETVLISDSGSVKLLPSRLPTAELQQTNDLVKLLAEKMGVA